MPENKTNFSDGRVSHLSSQVPVVDFSIFTNGDPSTRQAVANSIVEAFRTYGFVYLINHPVSEASISQAFRMSKMFFDLPLSAKTQAPHPPGFAVHRGYSHPGLEKVTDLTLGLDSVAAKSLAREVPDLKESYEIGSDNYLEQPNVWPPPNMYPGFRGFMTSFYWILAEFSKEILKALALGIGLEDENYLQKFYTGEHNQLRLLHYPEVEAKVLEEKKAVRVGAHCDWSAFTLLFQDDCGGLEIESPTEPGRFISVDPIENACLVNIGDLMARWSNDFLKSTMHRVGPPPLQSRYIATREMKITMARYSIPYFVTTTPESVIECLPPCVDEKHPAKYKPITQKEQNIQKVSMNYN
ncbi:hypothetical protein H072_1371 [Dactylellina haptotyla CBS 200.50]|uniref:Fe2OG dioxygenase domain-containing protein n=1 Tax=Dactylellina haptotyla (strain CBS 200.50) TaxID=1284197 RepID=S8AP14_DACHA|nr:hypothetical protein H072_1371 [Dactylellina haptotyla CBS 200.50]